MTTSTPGSTRASRYFARQTTYLHKDVYVFTWKINSASEWFAEIGEQGQYSHSFPDAPNAACKWRIQLYPFKNKGGITYCAVLLELLRAPKSVFVKYVITMSDDNGEQIEKLSAKDSFEAGSCFGWEQFIVLQTLLKKLKTDVLVISCHMELTGRIVNERRTVKPVPVGKALSNELATLLVGDKFGDATITVGTKKFLVYKGILAARSSVFAAMFEHNMIENTQNNVDIVDVQPDVFEELLRYIYTDTIKNMSAFAHQLFAAADKYCILSLKTLCQQVILTNLSVRNAAKTLLLADEHQATEMKTCVLQFLISGESRGVTETADWKNMALTHPHLISEVFEANISGVSTT